ncbi:flocculation protein FLO11-like [Schistocerca piceifrons]|uniref:flocculation protein FLO11-like n=1 Tax=Schistocerca piceifrons TaxID=274613 RepID=UPI001F5E7EF0|nr:flocculation protein FLO11-like [Schistocerca piceifrons]
MEEEMEQDDRSGETQGEADGGLSEVSRTTAASGPPSPTRTTSESVARGRRTDVEISANGRRRARTFSLLRRRIEPPIPLAKEELAAAFAMLTPDESCICIQRLATGTDADRVEVLTRLRSLLPVGRDKQLPVAVATTAAAPAVAPAVVATEAATPSPTSRLARKSPAAVVEDTPTSQASSGRAKWKRRGLRRRTMTASPRKPDEERFIAPSRRHTPKPRSFGPVTPEQAAPPVRPPVKAGTKQLKIPPIVVECPESYKALEDLLKNSLGNGEFSTKSGGGNKIKIFVKISEEYKKTDCEHPVPTRPTTTPHSLEKPEASLETVLLAEMPMKVQQASRKRPATSDSVVAAFFLVCRLSAAVVTVRSSDAPRRPQQPVCQDKPPNSDPHLVATAANPPTTHSHPQNRKSLPLGHPPPPPSARANDEQPAPIAQSLVGEEGQPGPAPAPPAPAATIAGDLQALLQTLKVQSCHSFPR